MQFLESSRPVCGDKRQKTPCLIHCIRIGSANALFFLSLVQTVTHREVRQGRVGNDLLPETAFEFIQCCPPNFGCALVTERAEWIHLCCASRINNPSVNPPLSPRNTNHPVKFNRLRLGQLFLRRKIEKMNSKALATQNSVIPAGRDTAISEKMAHDQVRANTGLL